jgi:septal ring factor EnvC (AmiA/AmiB activator)
MPLEPPLQYGYIDFGIGNGNSADINYSNLIQELRDLHDASISTHASTSHQSKQEVVQPKLVGFDDVQVFTMIMNDYDTARVEMRSRLCSFENELPQLRTKLRQHEEEKLRYEASIKSLKDTIKEMEMDTYKPLGTKK